VFDGNLRAVVLLVLGALPFWHHQQLSADPVLLMPPSCASLSWLSWIAAQTSMK